MVRKPYFPLGDIFGKKRWQRHAQSDGNPWGRSKGSDCASGRISIKNCLARILRIQQRNPPYGSGHRGKQFCLGANVLFTFAPRIAVFGVREWYTKDYEKGEYMKKKMILLIGCIILIFFFQFVMDVKAVNSMRVSSDSGNTEHITIIANKIFIFDKNSFAEYLIERRVDNSYKEIRFVDAFPKELEIDIYTNWFTWKTKHKNFSIFCHFKDSKHFIYEIKQHKIPLSYCTD